MKKILLSILLIFCVNLTLASNLTPEQMDVLQAGQQWAKALNARDPQKVASFYANDAYLYATFKPMLNNHHEILVYFENLTQKPNLQVTFTDQNIRIYGTTAINSGLYTFSYTENGKLVKIPARFTFVYELTPHGWIIEEHHSSVVPTGAP